MADKEDLKENGPADDHKKPHAKRGRRFWIIGGLVVLFLSGGLIYFGYWVFFARFNVGTDDAYVHGNQVSITPQVSGIVASVETDDTQLVQRGQVLVRLDQNDARVALEQAKAQLGQSVRQVRQLYQQEVEQKAAIAQRTHDLDLATRTTIAIKIWLIVTPSLCNSLSIPRRLGRQRKTLCVKQLIP